MVGSQHSSSIMAGSEQFVVSAEDTVLVDIDPNLPDVIAEEVVIDPSGGSSESVHFYQCQQEGIVEGIDAGSVVEVKEEEITYDDGSEEMSVAIDLAKLSQGHFSQRDRPFQSGEFNQVCLLTCLLFWSLFTEQLFIVINYINPFKF